MLFRTALIKLKKHFVDISKMVELQSQNQTHFTYKSQMGRIPKKLYLALIFIKVPAFLVSLNWLLFGIVKCPNT